MRVLLPPSETKISGGGNSHLNAQSLAFNEQLQNSRESVLAALHELSQNIDEAAIKLKTGARSKELIKNNLVLKYSPTLPAIKRYTGVLFDAIEYETLATQEREWINKNVYIQSALFGLISAADLIPNYRISADSKLKIEGQTLKKLWVAAHKNISADKTFTNNLVLDMRSKSYAALAPLENSYTLEVLTRNESGEVRALNHFNKAAKGALVKLLAQTYAQCETISDFKRIANDNDLEILCEDRTVKLFTKIGAPKSKQNQGRGTS